MDILKAEGLSKRFGSILAVDQVNFHIGQNETVGIIGPNGSGKTTFFNLISGLFHPTAGRILFFGNDITDIPPDKRVLAGMVRTFQLVSVFNSMTVWENLVLSVSRFRKERTSPWRFILSPADHASIQRGCYEAMKMVELESMAMIPTSELSYGFKRMLEIGIALSLKPKLLLLDEPFSGMDDVEISRVIELLQRIRKNFTLIIIEHKLSKIENLVDRLWVMNEGKFICEGEPNQVLCNTAVRECYWGKEEMDQ